MATKWIGIHIKLKRLLLLESTSWIKIKLQFIAITWVETIEYKIEDEIIEKMK